ncbi:MAG: cold shock domain-containing protein [Pyrinomonadaceae bacterium]|nr:cold shock domain-containing protein [Phycisphaerales bacterium]
MDEQDSASIRAATGVVKWFDSRKGFGFIIGPSGQDVLAHFTNIEGTGFRILKDGWTVVYDADRTSKGWKATRIILPPGALEADQPAPLPPPSKGGDSTKPKIVVVIKKPGQDSRDRASGGDSGTTRDTHQ